MPTYTYGCNCGVIRDDVFHSMSENPRIECDRCGQEMRKIPCQFGMQVRGFSPRKRHKQVDARIRRRENRPEWKKMSSSEKWRMKRMADKYGKGSPYLTDPRELKENKENARKRKRTQISKIKDEVKKIKGVKDVNISG